MKKFTASVLIAAMLASSTALGSYSDGDFDDVTSYEESNSRYEKEYSKQGSRSPAGDYAVVYTRDTGEYPTYDKKWRKKLTKKHKLQDKYHSAMDRGKFRQAARIEKRYNRAHAQQKKREATLNMRSRNEASISKYSKYGSNRSGGYSSGRTVRSGEDYIFVGGTWDQPGIVADSGWYSGESRGYRILGANGRVTDTANRRNGNGNGNGKGKGKTNADANDDANSNGKAYSDVDSKSGKGKTNEDANADSNDNANGDVVTEMKDPKSNDNGNANESTNDNANAGNDENDDVSEGDVDDVVVEDKGGKPNGDVGGKGRTNGDASANAGNLPKNEVSDVFQSKPIRSANPKANGKGNTRVPTEEVDVIEGGYDEKDQAIKACSGKKDCRKLVRKARKAIEKLDRSVCANNTSAKCENLRASILAQLDKLEECYPAVKREFFGKRWARGATSWVTRTWRKAFKRNHGKGNDSDENQPVVTDLKGKKGLPQTEVVVANQDENENEYMTENAESQSNSVSGQVE